MARVKTKVIRWGMIGCGAVTEVKSGPAYQQTSGFELCSVMRRDIVLAKDYAFRHQVKNFTNDAEQIINDDTIDAIYIATPPDSHKHYALKVAQAGKICCVEKPLAPSYQGALAIQQAFEEKGLPLFVAYYRRSLPRFNKIKQLIDEGAIGQLRHINWHLNKPANAIDLSRDYNWRTDSTIAKGGYFDDLASHGLDLFAYFLGEFKQVSGIGTNQQQLYSSFDALTACWQHTNGVTGTGSWNFGGLTRQDKVTMHGSLGEIQFSVFDEQPIVITTSSGTNEVFIENPKHIQKYHVENIQQQLEGGTNHPSTGTTAVHTSWVMDEILANNEGNSIC